MKIFLFGVLIISCLLLINCKGLENKNGAKFKPPVSRESICLLEVVYSDSSFLTDKEKDIDSIFSILENSVEVKLKFGSFNRLSFKDCSKNELFTITHNNLYFKYKGKVYLKP